MPVLTGTQTTIKVKPIGLTPTYNETIVVLESPNIQSSNFRWLIDIYKGEPGDTEYDDHVAAGTLEPLSTITILPNPDGYGVIDFHRHIENHITTDFYPADKDVLDMVTGAGFKWSFKVTEQFNSPIRWRFDDNTTAVDPSGFIGFHTNNGLNPDATFSKHPFFDGDQVIIAQDAGYEHEEYEVNPDTSPSFTTLTVIDEFTVLTDIPQEGDTAINPGIIMLIDPDNPTRSIEQIFTAGETTVYSFNGALTFQGFRNWDPADYLMRQTSSPFIKFLKEGPETFNVTLNDSVWLNSAQYDTSTGAPTVGYIKTDNGTYVTNNGLAAEGQNFIVQHKIGPKDLANSDFLTGLQEITTSGLPAVDANTTFITYSQADFVGGSFSRTSETITLNIVDDCSKYEAIRFFYIDKLGSYIPLTFNKVSRKNITNTRSNYRQNYGRYDSAAEAWGYTTYDRGTTTYDLVSTESITCTSDWLDEDQVSMVISMLNSPIVYIQDENGDYVAITITTNSYEVKKTVNDKLLNYTISFEHSQTNTNQRG